MNVKDLAAEIECVERTIHRDLAALELAGVPWYYDASQRAYRVRSNYWFPLLSLSDDELLGQGVATAITMSPGLNITAGAEPTSRKLAAMSDDHSGEILADAQQLVTVLGLKLYACVRAIACRIFDKLVTALAPQVERASSG